MLINCLNLLLEVAKLQYSNFMILPSLNSSIKRNFLSSIITDPEIQFVQERQYTSRRHPFKRGSCPGSEECGYLPPAVDFRVHFSSQAKVIVS